MTNDRDRTMRFHVDAERLEQAGRILSQVYQALQEKGYNPVSQMVGYLLSGDPTYITSHKNARSVIRSVERDELLEELVKSYLRARDDREANEDVARSV